MELVGSHDGNLVALLSAHQSIGVPQPLKLFGTEEQKKKYLPRCAARRDLGLRAHRAGRRLRPGAAVDHRGAHRRRRRLRPQRREALVHQRHARRAAGRDGARPRDRRKISAFVVETGLAGRRGRAPLPLHGPARRSPTACIRFTNVRVPAREPDRRGGQGPQDRAHHAQHRPARRCPASAVGTAKRCLEIVPRAGPASACSGASRSASTRRSRTRSPTWRRTTFAMESVAELACRDGRPRRLRHPARGGGRQGVEHRRAAGEIVDETMQIRGGRGYETEQLARARAARRRSRSSA